MKSAGTATTKPTTMVAKDGVLKSFNTDGFLVTVERKIKNEKNKNVSIQEDISLSKNEIKEIKRVISFK